MLPENMVQLGECRQIIREIAAYGTARKQVIGEDKVFDFSIGNPSVPSPKKVNESIIDFVTNMRSIDLHGYTASAGAACAREAAAKTESARAGYDIPMDCVYMTCGAAASLTITIKALCNPGDKVVVLAPFFPEYKVFIENAGAEMVIVPPADLSMQPDMKALESALDERVKAVIINSPNNPSGAILSEKTLTAMGRMFTKAKEKYGHELFIIADEPYRELVYDGKEVPFVPNFYPDTLICYSYSKSLSLPGERIGYVLVPPCVNAHDKVFAAVFGAGRSLGYVCAPSLMQYVISRCYDEKPDVAAYDRNRDLLYGALTEYGFECVRPEGAFYLFVKAPGGDAAEFCELAKKYELLFVPSDQFGVEGYVRIAYCTSEDMIRRSLPAFEKLAKDCL